MVGPRGPGLCHFPAGPLWASSHLQCLRRRAFEVSFSDCDFRSTHHTTTVPGVCWEPWLGPAGPRGTGSVLSQGEQRGPLGRAGSLRALEQG